MNWSTSVVMMVVVVAVGDHSRDVDLSVPTTTSNSFQSRLAVPTSTSRDGDRRNS